MSIKNVETDEPYYKARFVVHSYRYKEKESLVHNWTTIRQSSVLIMLALASIFGFRLWLNEINNAYLQSSSNLLRDVYLKPGRELELPAGHLFKLLRPLCGLADSGDY